MSLSSVSITSDKDYLKIHDDGLITISANGAPDVDSTFPADPTAPLGLTGSHLITHNLGTVPLVRAFFDSGKNGIWFNSEAYPAGVRQDPWLKIIPTTTTVKLIMNTDGAAKTDIPVFYRIYDLGNTSIDSDSRIDKIFFKGVAGGNTAASPDSLTFSETTLTIPHGEVEVPLFNMQFSADNSNWYGEGTRIVGPFDTASGPPGGPYARYYYQTAYVYADATNLYVRLQSNYPSIKTFYVRCEADYRL